MFDISTPATAEFGLLHPLPLNRDQNLYAVAATRLHDCHRQWRELTAQRPPDAEHDGWNDRAAGTPLSRKQHALRLYCQHFEAACQLACADRIISTTQMQLLEQRVSPSAATTGVHVTQPALKCADDSHILLPGALILRLDSVLPPIHLLYLPSHAQPLTLFKQRADLEHWLIGHCRQQARQKTPEDLTLVDEPLDKDPLRHRLELLMTPLAVDWLDIENMIGEAPSLSLDDPATNDPVLFGMLLADIPVNQRSQALQLEHNALERLLGDTLAADLNSPRHQQLTQQFDAVAQAAQASHTAASALLDSSESLKLLELRHASNAQYRALHQARLTGLRAEAELQRTLDQLTIEEHRQIMTLLDAPDQTIPAKDGVVARISLSVTEEQHSQIEDLQGLLVIAAPSGLDAGSTDSLLLYWPGHLGGLLRFSSRQALEQNLFRRLLNDPELALHLTPVSGDPFTRALDQQLYQCEQQAVTIIKDNPLPAHAEQRASELQKLREEHLSRLTVPLPQARELAFAQRLEQDRSVALAGRLPQWFGTLDEATCTRIKALISRYLTAMQQAHSLLEKDLPQRQTFSKKRIDARLREDFALQGKVTVSLDLPDATYWQKTLIEGAAPGTPQRNTLFASVGRSEIALEQLALDNIDQEMWWRLSFMQVKVSAEHAHDRQAIETGLGSVYLRKLVTELDLAGRYETLIRQAFYGVAADPEFAKAYRRECLSEPWRLMLQLQGEFAVLQSHIDSDGHALLKIAIDAATSEAYAVDGKRIALLPAHLTVGGTDTAHQGPSTLTGVTFIVEQVSGLTLLYLPDSTDGVFLRQYGTLETARMDLFNRCVHSNMVNYLAGRTLSGDFASHVSRINQAQLRNFNALIGTGLAWPTSTSLATHLLDVHMGRMLEAHRSSSRSNDALYMERCALKSGALFNYLKMALGMLPFVGSAIALYDAWNSANLAVAAFLRGDIGHGLAEVESVLLCLIDAAMDVLPGSVSVPAAARLATRLRQDSALGKTAAVLQRTSRQRARQSLDRFKGYEYEREVSLAGLQADSHGIYRNVYRHADGDFIVRQGRIYRVQLGDSARSWRLYGTWTRSYKMPIALDETGHWNTHYAVHGVLIDGGGVGGGAVLGHLADGLDPLWPEPVRQWLPRWWTDRQLRRQLTLTNTVDAYTRRLDTQTRSSNQLLESYQRLAIADRQPLRASADAACVNDIDTAVIQYQNLAELLTLSHGRKRVQIEDIQSRCAWIVVDRSIQRVTVARDKLLEHLNQIEALVEQSDATPPTHTSTQLRLMNQRKAVRKIFLKEFDHLHAITEQASLWNSRISNRAQKAMMARDMAALTQKLGETTHCYLKAAHILEIITRYDEVADLSWVYFHVQLKEARVKTGRALLMQHQLPEVQASLAQRNRVLEDCLDTYAGFRRQLNAWILGYPQHLDLEQINPFLDALTKVEEQGRHAIKHRPPIKPREASNGKQLFETESNQLLIGIETIDAVTRQKRFTIEGIDGYRETWLPRSSGKYHLQAQSSPASPPLPSDVRPLLAEAAKRLADVDAYRNRVSGYARQDMLPVDLEHILMTEAAELNTRAQSIERLSPTESVILRLNDKAQELRWAARTLRIDQSMRSKTPSEGYLDYLLQQRVVDIRKDGAMRALGKRADGRKDFLQEYEVRDLTSNPPRRLWYAHFHYTSDKAPFEDFVKAHLKLPEQRNLGLQLQQAQATSGAMIEAIWRGDIGKPLGIKHFSAL